MNKPTIASLKLDLAQAQSNATHWNARYTAASNLAEEQRNEIAQLKVSVRDAERQVNYAREVQARQTQDTLAYFMALATPSLACDNPTMRALLAQLTLVRDPNGCTSMLRDLSQNR